MSVREADAESLPSVGPTPRREGIWGLVARRLLRGSLVGGRDDYIIPSQYSIPLGDAVPDALLGRFDSTPSLYLGGEEGLWFNSVRIVARNHVRPTRLSASDATTTENTVPGLPVRFSSMNSPCWIASSTAAAEALPHLVARGTE